MTDNVLLYVLMVFLLSFLLGFSLYRFSVLLEMLINNNIFHNCSHNSGHLVYFQAFDAQIFVLSQIISLGYISRKRITVIAY